MIVPTDIAVIFRSAITLDYLPRANHSAASEGDGRKGKDAKYSK
jgi:hypothetical protein